MKCPSCGGKVSGNTRLCRHCGHKFLENWAPEYLADLPKAEPGAVPQPAFSGTKTIGSLDLRSVSADQRPAVINGLATSILQLLENRFPKSRGYGHALGVYVDASNGL